jgi:hypothetical protein
MEVIYFIYSRAIKGGGAVLKSTSSGGASTQTSSSGGGVSTSTASGGSTTTTSGASSYVDGFVLTTTPVEGEYGLPAYENHMHRLNTIHLQHSHSVSIPAHTHNFSVPNHSHTVNIPAHTHNVQLEDHTHEIEHGIFKLDRLPTAVTIKVDGNTVPYTQLSGEDIDLIPYLATDNEGRVVRGWHTVEITPNDLGRIHAQLMAQFFVQSRGGVNV